MIAQGQPVRLGLERRARHLDVATDQAILKAVPKLPVQLGGGIRDRAGIDAWLAKGVARVILGTAALSYPALVRDRDDLETVTVPIGWASNSR